MNYKKEYTKYKNKYLDLKNKKYINIFKTDKYDEKITYLYKLHKFCVDINKNFTYMQNRVIVVLLLYTRWKNFDLTNEEYFKQIKEAYLRRFEYGIIKKKWEDFEKKLLEIYNKHFSNNDKYNYKILSGKDNDNKDNNNKNNNNKDKFLIPLKKIGNRDSYDYKYTEYDKVITNLKYFTMDIIAKGDQWSLLSDEDIKNYQLIGYQMEVFGSPFNARMRYFGSIFDTDEPFGRVGSYDEILQMVIDNKDVKWRDQIVIPKDEKVKILINQPSSVQIAKKVVNFVSQIMKKRKCILVVCFPTSYSYNKIYQKLIDDFKEQIVNIKMIDIAYDIYDEKKVISLKGREWIYFWLAN